jgi:hypothetical protein
MSYFMADPHARVFMTDKEVTAVAVLLTYHPRGGKKIARRWRLISFEIVKELK